MSQPPAGDAPADQDMPSSLGLGQFERLPTEVRLAIYKFHFYDMIATLPETSLTIEYHFCDRKYEVTTDLNRFRAQNHAGRFLHLVCVSPGLRQEIEPELYDCFKFIVTLRQHWNPLDLSEGDRYMLSHARRLEIHLSNDRICMVMPTHHQIGDQSLYRGVRRDSWDGASSLTFDANNSNQRLRISRRRLRSWSAPDQKTPYIDRLDSLFDAFGRDINLNLKSLDIFISDIHCRNDYGAIARQLDGLAFENMLNHIGVRVRLSPSDTACVATLHLGQRVGDLLSREFINKFLNYIEYRSTHRGDFSGVIATEPRRVVSHHIYFYLIRSALLYLKRPSSFQVFDQIKDIFGLNPFGLRGLFRHMEFSIPEDEWWTFRLPPR